MKENDLKSIWCTIHEKNQDYVGNLETLKARMKKSHSKTISKIINELKLKILIYSIALFTLIGLILYAFVYLSIELSLSISLPFILVGSFLIFKVISEINRYLVFNNRNDNLSIKDSTIFCRKRLDKIKNIDYYITFVLCYGIAIIYSLGYIFNISGLKEFAQSIGLSVLLSVFIFLLFVIPWIIRKSFNQRYTNFSLILKSTLDYLDDDVS